MPFSGQTALRRSSKLKAALVAGTLLTSLAVPTFAQTYSPPVRRAIDDNGVDVIRKTYDVKLSYISIGPDFPAGFTYGSRDSTNVLTAYITRSGSTYYVTANGQSDSFTLSGSVFTNTEANGSTLVQNAGQYTYTTSDGVATLFTVNSAYYPYYQDGFARATAVTFPDGTRWTYNYKAVQFCPDGVEGGICPAGYKYAKRLQGISSNRGYQAKFQFAVNAIDDLNYDTSFAEFQRLTSVKLFNNAYVYCDISANGCSPSGTWPTATITPTSVTGGSGTTVTDNEGRATRVIYYTAGNIGIKRPGAATDNIIVGRSGGVVNSITVDGVNYSYSYATAGNTITTTVTDPNGKTKVYTGDTTTFLISSFKDELNRTTSYLYDGNGRLTRVTSPEGNYVQYTYDGRGNITETRQVAKSGSGLADIVTSAGYDSSCSNAKICNKPLWTKDAKGNQTDYTYDAGSGGLLTAQLPAPTAGATRPKTTYGYADYQAYYYQTDYYNPTPTVLPGGFAVRLPTSMSTCQTLASCAGSADEIKSTVSYGPQTAGVANNLLPVSVSSGSGNGALTATTAVTYDGMSNLLTVDGPLAGAADTTRYRYDTVRRRIGMVTADPDGASSRKPKATKISYNADSQPTLVEQGTVNSQSDADWNAFNSLQQLVSTYDANARKTSDKMTAIGATYGVTQYSYDSLGRVDCTAIRMNSAAWGSLPASACTLQTDGTAGNDRITKINYDAAGQATSVVEGHGTTVASTTMTATYSNNGQQMTAKDGENNLTTYEYDGFDRLFKTRFPNASKGAGSSSTTDYTQNSYDANGNATNVRLRDGQNIGFSYDNLNRLTLKDRPGSEPDVSYSYDLQGRMTGASQSGNAVTFGYDALGRNTSQGGPLGTVQMQYDLAGHRTGITWPDGFQVSYSYGNNGAMGGIYDSSGITASFAYDDLGRRTSVGRITNASTYYGYDAMSRLNAMTHDLAGAGNDLSLSFAYNPASQITQKTASNPLYSWQGHANANRAYAANGRNQYTSAGTTSFSYDARGNLTTSGSSGYGYSSENYLTTGPNASLSYDPLGRLYQVTSSSTNTRFLYAGTELIGEYNSAGAVLRRYVHGPRADEPIVRYEEAGLAHRWFFHADERGSIVSMSDGAGSMFQINSYDEYGIPGAGNGGRFQYTGQTWIPELGMYYYKARFYSPTLGRFMQTDPIGYADGMNLYAYVGNDPVGNVDTDGTRSIQNWHYTPIDPDHSKSSESSANIVVTGQRDCGIFCSSVSGYYGITNLMNSMQSFGKFNLDTTMGEVQADIVVEAKKSESEDKELANLVWTLNLAQCLDDVSKGGLDKVFSTDGLLGPIVGAAASGMAEVESNQSKWAGWNKPQGSGLKFSRGSVSRGSLWGAVVGTAYNLVTGMTSGANGSSSCGRL